MDRSPELWSLVLDWSILTQMRALNPRSTVGPKAAVLIGENRTTRIGQSCAALLGWVKSQSYWLE